MEKKSFSFGDWKCEILFFFISLFELFLHMFIVLLGKLTWFNLFYLFTLFMFCSWSHFLGNLYLLWIFICPLWFVYLCFWLLTSGFTFKYFTLFKLFYLHIVTIPSRGTGRYIGFVLVLTSVIMTGLIGWTDRQNIISVHRHQAKFLLWFLFITLIFFVLSICLFMFYYVDGSLREFCVFYNWIFNCFKSVK